VYICGVVAGCGPKIEAGAVFKIGEAASSKLGKSLPQKLKVRRCQKPNTATRSDMQQLDTTRDFQLLYDMASGMTVGAGQAAAYNFCEFCHCPCEVSGSELICPRCFATKQTDENQVDRRGFGGNPLATRKSFSSDNYKTQLQNIEALLTSNNTDSVPASATPSSGQVASINSLASSAPAPPPAAPQKLAATPEKKPPIKLSNAVIQEVAQLYAKVQACRLTVVDAAGTPVEVGLVNRGDTKNQILGYLIFLVSATHGTPYLERDIAAFMKTRTLTDGYKIIRGLQVAKKISLPAVDYSMFIKKYLAALGLSDPAPMHGLADSGSAPAPTAATRPFSPFVFVRDLVAAATKHNVSHNSIFVSKVAGAIWLLNLQLQLGFSAKTVETCCDHIRKNTFERFVVAVTQNIDLFADLFCDHGVPMPPRGNGGWRRVACPPDEE